jgi:hypothetical protein
LLRHFLGQRSHETLKIERIIKKESTKLDALAAIGPLPSDSRGMLLIAAGILFLLWGGGLALRLGEYIHMLPVIGIILVGMHLLGSFAPSVV